MYSTCIISFEIKYIYLTIDPRNQIFIYNAVTVAEYVTIKYKCNYRKYTLTIVIIEL